MYAAAALVRKGLIAAAWIDTAEALKPCRVSGRPSGHPGAGYPGLRFAEIGPTRSSVVADRDVCWPAIGRSNAGLTRQWPEGLQQTVAVLRFSLVISPCSVRPSSVVNSTRMPTLNLARSTSCRADRISRNRSTTRRFRSTSSSSESRARSIITSPILVDRNIRRDRGAHAAPSVLPASGRLCNQRAHTG
jgi:hypothetical protein